MGKDKDVAEGEEEKRKKLLEEGAKKITCPVCGSTQARFREKDQAIVCREGHTVFMNGDVILPNGMRTTMAELREEGIIKKLGGK